MKKLISMLLVITTLAASVPFGAFAEGSYQALIALSKIDYLDKLCAFSENAPDWHDGMPLDGASSRQVEQALTSLLDEIGPSVAFLEKTTTAQEQLDITGDEADTLRQARNDARACQDEIEACLDTISYMRDSIPGELALMNEDIYASVNEKEAYANRVLWEIDELEYSLQTVYANYDGWCADAKRFSNMITPDDPDEKEIPADDDLLTHIVSIRSEYMDGLLGRLSEIADEERAFFPSNALPPSDVEIYAVSKEKLCFDVTEGEGKERRPITDATVKVWSENGNNRTELVAQYDADAKGYVVSAVALGLAEDGYLTIGYEITRDGKQTQYAPLRLCKGGDIFRVNLKDKGNDAYITGASFNGEDMYWGGCEIYITPANDARQRITVYLDSAYGRYPETLYMYYTQTDGSQGRATARIEKSGSRSHADFIGLWCSLIQPGTDVSFSLNDARITVADDMRLPADGKTNGINVSQLKANPATIPEPKIETQNTDMLNALFGANTDATVTFPKTSVMTFLKASVGYPLKQFGIITRGYVGINGSLMVLIGRSKEFDKGVSERLANSKWKTESQKMLDRALEKQAEKLQKSAREISKDFLSQKDNINNFLQNKWLGSLGAWWSMFICVQGKKTPVKQAANEEAAKNGSGKPLYDVNAAISIGAAIGAKGQVSFDHFWFPTPVPINIGVSFGGSVGIGLMANAQFYARSETIGTAIKSFKLQSAGLLAIIPISVFAAVSVGAGDLFRFGLKASLSLNMALPILVPPDQYKKQVTVSFSVGLSFTVDALFVIHADILIARFSWAFQNGESKKPEGYYLTKKPDENIVSLDEEPLSRGLYDTMLSGPSEEKKNASTEIPRDTDVIWGYEPQPIRQSNGGASSRIDSAPATFFLQAGDNRIQFFAWAENNQVMISPNDLANGRALQLPAEYRSVINALESGKYTIVNVSASDAAADRKNDDPYIEWPITCYTAVLAVTYAKSQREAVVTLEDRTIKTKIPDEIETMVLPLALLHGQNYPSVLCRESGETGAVILMNTRQDEGKKIVQIYPYATRLFTKEYNGGLCIDAPISYGLSLAVVNENNEVYIKNYRYTSTDAPDPVVREKDLLAIEDISLVSFAGLNGIPVAICNTTDDDVVVKMLTRAQSASSGQAVLSQCFDIRDFLACNISTDLMVFFLQSIKDGEGKIPEGKEAVCALKAFPLSVVASEERPGDGTLVFRTGADAQSATNEETDEVWDFETDVAATRLYAGRLNMRSVFDPVIYWYDCGDRTMKEADGPVPVARVRAVSYDSFTKKATRAFTMATLYGNDGDLDGKETSLIPSASIVSFIGGNDDIIFTRDLLNANEEGEGDSASFGPKPQMVYKTTAKRVASVDIVGVTSEYHSITAGGSANMNFTVRVNGNLPLNSISMDMVRVLPDGKEELVTNYHFNIDDSGKNSVTNYSDVTDDVDVRTGRAAIRRAINIFDYSDLTNYYPEHANDEKHIAECFMPEGIYSFKTSLNIPSTWDGKQRLRLKFSSYGATLNACDESDGATQDVLLDCETGRIFAMNADGGTEAAPLTLDGGILEVAEAEPWNMEFDVVGISASFVMHDMDGEPYISTVISQAGNNAANDSRGNIVLRAYVDDDLAFPSFTHTFSNHTTGEIALALDAPVRVLTGGRTADELTLLVTDESEGNTDPVQLDNTHTFYLGQRFGWLLQPEDRTADEGAVVSFTAVSRGGSEPYTYRWYRLDGTKWTEVSVGDTLRLGICTEEMNGAQYRCTATDALGQTITSRAATLTVIKRVVPKTGDTMNPARTMLLAAVSLSVLALLYAKRRKERDR